MEDSLFRNYDNNNKYVKAPYQGAVAKIGHLEYLYDYLKENLLSDWTLSDEGYAVGIVVFDTDGLYRNDVEGNTTQPSSNSPTNGWTLISGIGKSSYTPPYKVYTALLTQTGTNAPEATVLENTLNTTISFTRNDLGTYIVVATDPVFTTNKTVLQVGSNFRTFSADSSFMQTSILTNSQFNLYTLDQSLNYEDGILENTLLEIRVYN